MVATARSWSSPDDWTAEWVWSSAVNASITWPDSSQKMTVMATRTATDSVMTAEMARHASRSLRVASRSTNTGMNVAERTPPRTMSYSMFGVVLARL